MTWYDSDYSYKKKITIDKTKVAGDETDFPVLISVTDNDLRDEANGGHVKSASGYDIIFTNGTETAQLNHEIERYVNTNGLLVFWVKIPSLSSTADTDFYIYYGKTGVVADPSSTDTWDSSFVGVYHLNESAGATCNDSTSGSNDGTYNGDLPDRVTGQTGYGQDLDGTGDYISFGSGSHISATGTVEIWGEQDDADEWCYYYHNVNDTATYSSIQLRGNPGAYHDTSGVFDDSSEWDAHCGTPDTNWNYFGLAWQTHDMVVYRNKVSELTSNTCEPSAFAYDNYLFIGCHWQEDRGYFNGVMDEIRFSNIRRSNNWLNTTYETEKNPDTFMDWGAEEQGTVTHVTSDSVSISDDIIFQHEFNLFGTATINDSILYEHFIDLIDTINISDSILIKRLLSLFDTLAIGDNTIIKRLISLIDDIGISDDLIYKHIIALADSIGISDSLLIRYLISISDSMGIGDSILFEHFINLIDTINITDSTDFGGLTFAFDNISILDDIDIVIKDTCGTVFQLHGNTYAVFLPIPDYAGESGSINNELVLFDFWYNDRSIDTIGINSEPIILGGVIFACTDDEEVEMTAIASKFLNWTWCLC